MCRSHPGSLPAWGVWIEIVSGSKISPPCAGHSPHGECGLKLFKQAEDILQLLSLPAWGVWIEIGDTLSGIAAKYVTPRMGSVD